MSNAAPFTRCVRSYAAGGALLRGDLRKTIRPFQSDSAGEPIIRKASAHGLGHLLPPYENESKQDERDSGVRQWQEDVWKSIIKSLRSSNPLEVRLDWREELSQPAVSQYSAATPDRLDWFNEYNKGEALRAKGEAV
jgi:hypothetical protein